MNRNALASIIVAVVGAVSTVLITQLQETTRQKLAEEEAKARLNLAIAQEDRGLRTALILRALEVPEAEVGTAEGANKAIRRLELFVSLGLLEEELGSAIAAYVDEQGDAALASFPTFSPSLEAAMRTMRASYDLMESLPEGAVILPPGGSLRSLLEPESGSEIDPEE